MNFQVLKDLVTFCLTIWGLIVATKGLATWKEQTKGIKQFETAHNLHFAVLKVREAIKHVRNPFIGLSESQRAVKFIRGEYPEKSDEEVKKDEHAAVYEVRWKKISDSYTEAESHLLAAEVLWGPEIVNLIKPLSKKVNELNINLKQNFSPPELRAKKMTDIHDIIYDASTEIGQDQFSKEVSGYINSITEYLKDKIR